MNVARIKIICRLFAVTMVLALSACSQRVTLVPGEDDLVTLNGCVLSACNYLAVVGAQHKLEKNFWAKILLVRFENHPAGHAYCVWETGGTIYGYDRNSGAFPLPVYTRDARAIAIVLAQELGKVLKQPLAVSNAEFVDADKAEFFKYASLELQVPAHATMATAFQLSPLTAP
jgi:hypothetical protein